MAGSPPAAANEYQLAEIFSNDTGNIRVQGLPYGTYLVVETTVPHDLFQAEPLLSPLTPNRITTRGALWPPPRTA
ncbi:MAG: prealbumin-like fold domain-containing protein [Gemmiger formicilis]|uniref:prealbumin-like fold domain-containing protein n=1 Tax=Gemmiger formicilis TaxID=745368 RepID=UPI0039A3E8D9